MQKAEEKLSYVNGGIIMVLYILMVGWLFGFYSISTFVSKVNLATVVKGDLKAPFW